MIEDLARSAADDLRTATTGDVEAGLLDVYAAHRRHRRHSAWAAVAAVALALGVGWWGGQVVNGDGPTAPQPLRPPYPVIHPELCRGPVECLGSSTYRFALTRSVRWHIPPGYGADSGSGATDWLVESYWQGRGPTSGVTVMEGVRAPGLDGTSAQSGVAATPRAYVSWLASRPYLVSSHVARTRVGGRPAWRVRVALRAGVPDGRALCTGRFACYATTYTPDHDVTGIWGDMVADYTALRVPGVGTTVVWSWAFSHDRAALARNRAAVRGLSWPGA